MNEWKTAVIEMLKWGAVLYLLWPIVTLRQGQFSLIRLLMGIVLFVIFSGKLLYDYIVRDYIQSRYISRKRDLITFLGIVLGSALIVGLVIFIFAVFILQFAASTDPVQQNIQQNQ